MTDGLIGAIIGGLISGLASFGVIWAQISAARREHLRYAKSLFEMLASLQSGVLGRMIEERASSGNIWYRFFDEAKANYEIFQRNKELLAHFRSFQMRRSALDTFHDFQQAVSIYERFEVDRFQASQLAEDKSKDGLARKAAADKRDEAAKVVENFAKRMSQLKSAFDAFGEQIKNAN